MRKKIILALLSVFLALPLGCVKHVQVPIPGQINTFDGTSYRTLMDAQAAIQSVRANVTSGQLVLSPAQKKVFNQIIVDYNTTEALWHAYHAGATSDATALTAAIQSLVADISTIATQFGGK